MIEQRPKHDDLRAIGVEVPSVREIERLLILVAPISMIMGWLNSVVYVSALSLWALVSGHWSAWQAARVEVAQEREAKKHQKEDIPGDVVAALIEHTNIKET